MKIVDNKYKVFFEHIQNNFSQSKNSIHIARNEVKVLEFETQLLVVKSFGVPSFFKKIIYTFFRDSKAKKSFNNALNISNFSPRAIGYVEFKKYGLLSKSYYVCENFNYDFTIREPLVDEKFEDRENIFKSFALFTFKLHEENILHLDFSPGNILVQKGEGKYIFKIVDINRMLFKVLSLNDRMQNLQMLWANDEDISLIVKYYCSLGNFDYEKSLSLALKYSQKHKNIKNLKKRLKGKKVVD